MDGTCTSEKHGSMVVYVAAWLSTAEYSRAQYRRSLGVSDPASVAPRRSAMGVLYGNHAVDIIIVTIIFSLPSSSPSLILCIYKSSLDVINILAIGRLDRLR